MRVGGKMKREFLTKELGLSKEVTEKIMAQYGESVNSLKKQNESLLEENEGLKMAMSETDEIKMRSGELESKNSELLKNVEELTSQLNALKVGGKISEKLSAAGAKNLKAVSALIDKSKINIEDGEVFGLSEQLKKIKDECDYLFYDENQSSGMRHSAAPNQADGFTSYARAGAKLN